jgi:hypothetical protein
MHALSGYECDPAKITGDIKLADRLKKVALAADGVLQSVSCVDCVVPLFAGS